MKALIIVGVFFLLFAIAGGGCGANPYRTHRGELLDDKVTSQRVQEALNRAGPDFKNVHVSITNGVVVLTGTVASPQDRARAEGIGRGVERVTKLEDDLQVHQAPQ